MCNVFNVTIYSNYISKYTHICVILNHHNKNRISRMKNRSKHYQLFYRQSSSKLKLIFYFFLIVLTFIYLANNLWIIVQKNDIKESFDADRQNRTDRKENHFFQYKNCKPERNIVFHKIHKCSTSSVQNILLRYALKHELNVVLPKLGTNFGYIHPFSADLLFGTPWQIAGLEYNLFCLHNRWNGAEVEKLFDQGKQSQKKPIYFTILRDPIDLFISLWDYLELGKQIYGGITLEEYALSDKKGKYQDRINSGANGRNQMMWEFGLNSVSFDNAIAIKEKIDEIDSTFDLVLLKEKFDESIILLKDLLCWDYSDVTSLTLNAHDPKTKSKLSGIARQKLQHWMHADYQLYNHFKAKFETKLDSFGHDRMQYEIQILHRTNQIVHNQCVIAQVANLELALEDRLYGHDVLGYQLNTENSECTYMGLREAKFLDILRQMQTTRAEEASGIQFDDDLEII